MGLIERTKNQRFLFFSAAICIFLIVVIFIISILISKNRKPENPAAPRIFNNTLSDEDIKKMSNTVKLENEKESVSSESIKSLNTNSEKNTQAISDGALKGSVAPSK